MKKGKGENDAELLIGVTLDGGQLQKDLEAAFSKLNSTAINKKAGDLGKGFMNNLLGGDGARKVNERVAAIADSLRKLDQITKDSIKLGNEGKSSKKVDEFLKPFNRLTSGLSVGADKMAEVRRHLVKEKAALQGVLDSVQSLANNAPKNSRALDIFSSLPDEKKLTVSERNLKRVAQQLEAEKKLLDDMRKMHRAAREAGLTGVAAELAGRLPGQAARVSQYSRTTDLAAAQKRADKAQADADKRASEERLAQERYQADALAAARKKAADDRRKAAVKAVEEERKEIKKAQEKADREGEAHAKKVQAHRENFALGRSALGRRNRFESSAADRIARDPSYGAGLIQSGNKSSLQNYNAELSKAAGWHQKMADFLKQEEVAAGKLGLSTARVTKELESEVAALNKIKTAQKEVQQAIETRIRLEEKAAALNNSFKATVQGNRLKNTEGDRLVKQQGGYTGFSVGDLRHADLKKASAALSDMARAVEVLRNGEAKLGNDTRKLDERLRLIANSAATAKTALEGMAKTHGLARVNSELLATVKNFAKFALVYQGLYAVLGYVKQLTGALFDLNKELANMQAITGETKKSMEEVSVAILQTASNSRFSIGEMTEAAKVIAQAGKSAQELPSVLKAVSDFASGTDTSLATSADIITSIGEVYKDLSEADIANQLTKAVNLSKLNGEDLKTILSLGAQVGEGYNITSEQMLAAASALRNAGIKASTVATGLRQAMVEVFNLQDGSAKDLQEAYAKKGQDLSLSDVKAKFYNFKNEADPLLAVLRELKSLGFGAEGDFTLGRSFDLRALNVLKALTTNTQDYLKLQKEITFGQPAAEAAAASMDSLNAQMVRFNNILTELLSTEAGGLFSGLSGALKKLNDFIEKRNELKNKELADTPKEAPTSFAGKAFQGVKDYYGFIASHSISPAAQLAYRGADSLGYINNSASSPEERAQAAQKALAKSTERFNALQERIKAYDPDAEGEGSLKNFIQSYEDLLYSVSNSLDEVAGGNLDAATQIKDLTVQYAAEGNEEKRKALLDQINKLTADGRQLGDAEVRKMAEDIQAMEASSQAAVENFASLYAKLEELALENSEAGKVAAAQVQALNSPQNKETTQQLLRGGYGEGHPNANIEAYRASMLAISNVADKGSEQIINDQVKATMDSFEAQLAIAAATPNGGAEAAIEAVVRQFADNIALMGAGFAAPALQALQDSAARAFSQGGGAAKILEANPGGGSVANIAKFIPGVTGYGGGSGVFPTQSNLIADRQKAAADKVVADKAAAQARYDAEHSPAVAKLEERRFVPDAAANARANELDLEILKLQKFGDAAGRAGDLLQEKNAILAGEKSREIEVAEYNLKAAEQHGKKSDDYRKAEADLAEKRLDLQKVQLQGQEDYLDNMQKHAVKEMSMYDQQKKTILAAGGSFDGLSELNSTYMSTQQKLITEMENYMRNTLNMTEDEIDKYIESRPELKKGLLTDKDYNAVDKKHKAAEKAAAAAVPTSATTGNALMDAKARAGLGFTNAENSRFALDKQAAIQNEIGVLLANNQADSILAQNADPALAEQANSNIETRTAAIRDLNLEIQDLDAELSDFSSTAVGELQSVFNEEGIRAFTTALEDSGNALKDWGDNIRDSLLTAWDSVGDAISSAILDGESFVDSMEQIARDLAREVFTMTTKNMMNNLLLGGLTGSYGGATPAGGAQAAAGAQPAGGGGFLSSVTSALGLGSAAGGSAAGGAVTTGSMSVTAGTVTVNGAAGGAGGVVDELTGGGSTPGKDLFQGLKDKLSSGMDSVMSSLKGTFKGLSKEIGGLLSGIGDVASDLWKGASGAVKDVAGDIGSWVSTLFAAEGAIIPAKFAGGYVSKSGIIKGPGTGTSDSIRGSMFTKSGRAPIAVSSGESILTAKATNLLGASTIQSLNAGTAGKFAAGGVVNEALKQNSPANLKQMAPSVTVMPPPPQNITVVNSLDSGAVFQQGIKAPGSMRVILNELRANKSSVQRSIS